MPYKTNTIIKDYYTKARYMHNTVWGWAYVTCNLIPIQEIGAEGGGHVVDVYIFYVNVFLAFPLSTDTHAAVIEGVELFMINSTAVEVFWQPVSLPMGVSILAHTVYFVALNQSFLEKGKVCETSVSFCEVAGLASHALYNFRVSYTLLDIDGLYSESTLSNASTIFLQGI